MKKLWIPFINLNFGLSVLIVKWNSNIRHFLRMAIPYFKKILKNTSQNHFFNPLPICLADFKKPLLSLYIACIHFVIYISIFFYLFLKSLESRHKEDQECLNFVSNFSICSLRPTSMVSDFFDDR